MSSAQSREQADARPRQDADRESAANPVLLDRLGYLLKHAQQRLNELTNAALEPFDLLGRDLAVLLVLSEGEPASQQEAARRLDVDRTTMVALLDALERKGFVSRHPAADDRRRNVVELTEHGRRVFKQATAAGAEAERRFLDALSEEEARLLKQALRVVVTAR